MSRSVAVSLAAAVLAAAAFAAAPARADGPSADKILKRMDADGDGKVSRSEWLNPPPAFKNFDSDGDGFITRAELDARFGGGPGAGPKGEANAGAGPGAARPPIDWIDVHVHPTGMRTGASEYPQAVRSALEAMDESHISHMVLMPQPMVTSRMPNGKAAPPAPIELWIEEARKYPDRFVVMGGGGSLNGMIHEEGHDGHPSETLKERFADRAEAIMKLGAVGFGELSVLHLSLIPGHAFEDVPGDHPLLLMLADITAKHDVVIDVHFDLVLEDTPRPGYLSPDNPAVFKRNIDGFERFLAHNRGAKISWAHAGSDMFGFWTAAFSREMLAKHPNLYMSLRMGMGRSKKNHPLLGNQIDPDWLKTFQDFPDRFFLGGDQFFIAPGTQGPTAQFAKNADAIRRRSQLFLSLLPEDLALKIGRENAMRVYKIKAR